MTKKELSVIAGFFGFAFCIFVGYTKFGENGGMIGFILGILFAAYIYEK